jgi:hypothetical protein
MGIELVGSSFVSHVPLAAEAGAGWVRFNGVQWEKIEPQEGVRDWNQAAPLETRALAVAETGMNFIAIVKHTPAWAQALPGHSCGPILPEKLAAFGQFMYDLVARYSQPPYNVHYWELGNEPDIDPALVSAQSSYGCWGDQTAPYYGGEYYAEMLKVVYPQIKAADPNAQVLLGGLLMSCDPNNPPVSSTGEPQDCLPARFLEGILESDGGAYFDGISFHAYDYYLVASDRFGNGWRSGPNQGLPVVYYKTAYLREILAQYGYPEKYLLNTETALLCGRDLNEPECATEAFNLTKANYLAQSFTVAKGEGLRANIWYHFQEGWRFSGLVDGALQPLPALNAYRFITQMLDGTVPWTKVIEYPNVVGYKFIRPGTAENQEIWVLWSADGTPSTVVLPEIPFEGYDVLGQPVSVAQSLDVTASVLYVVWTR